MTRSVGLGNELNKIVQTDMGHMFVQGELAQLSHSSFDNTATKMNESDLETISVEYPAGYSPDKTSIIGKKSYNKDEPIQRYVYLSHIQLPMNGIYQLVIIVEAMLGDIIRKIILKFPDKLDSKRQLKIKEVLSCKSISELHLTATNSFLNEPSYKSPRDFADEVREILSVKLLGTY